MAGWISSKLKVAESLLQQIDQQAADSLKKGDNRRSEDGLDLQIPSKPSGSVSLKDQLGSRSFNKSDDVSKKLNTESYQSHNAGGKVLAVATKPRVSVSDSDWTELLGSPKQSGSSTSRSSGSSVGSGISRLRKQGGKAGLGSSSNGKVRGSNRAAGSGSVTTVRKVGNNVAEKKNVSNSVRENVNKSVEENVNKSVEEVSKDSSFSTPRVSSVESESEDKVVEGWELDEGSLIVDGLDEETKGNQETKTKSDPVIIGSEMKSANELNLSIVNEALREASKPEIKDKRISIDVMGRGKAVVGVVSHVPVDLKRTSYSESDGEYSSDSDSSSNSDSDGERKEEIRRRRHQILAEKAAAKAAEAIKERENLVARMEGEKESLEKILEERAKQAAQEASELQSTMMETMEAVDLEKQKHNTTRMEALPRLAKLETENAGLARSLATVEWNLQIEVNHVAELREQIASIEAAHEGIQRRIAKSQPSETSPSHLVASRGIQLEKEMLEAECSFVMDKIARLGDKAKNLEEDIEVTQKEMENPSEVELELKGRLCQMTDHLIQKQAQVEALSSEKAMLLFRIEAVSKLLEENKSLIEMVNSSASSHADLESGAWERSKSKLPPMFKDKIHTGKQHLWSFLRQLDAIYVAGAVFLSRNPAAKIWSLVYIACLHFWVLYIFLSYSWSSSETRSGAVLSIENLNTNGSGI